MRPTPTTVAVLGTSGYAGQVLSALLDQHPSFRRVEVEAREVRPEQVAKAIACEAVCLALPREAAKEWVAALKLAARRLPKIIDLSDAHRAAAATSDTIHYGQPELFGPPPAGTEIVANPGCYPTATLLSLQPLIRAGLIDPAVAVVGASGATGAGKGLADHLHFYPSASARDHHLPDPRG
jgi:N-acetyl-gamma-glutamyl-phosphate reductase